MQNSSSRQSRTMLACCNYPMRFRGRALGWRWAAGAMRRRKPIRFQCSGQRFQGWALAPAQRSGPTVTPRIWKMSLLRVPCVR
jgi:hypothetical protein